MADEFPRTRLTIVALATAYVALSSVLGLGVTAVSDGDLVEAWAFIVDVWSASILADLVFITGTIVAGMWALAVARRNGPMRGAMAGFFANWAVYWISFVTLNATGSDVAGLEATSFVLEWGWPGLLFAAGSPVWIAHVLGPMGDEARDREIVLEPAES